jgi:predicted metal-dependent hydrolase
VKTGRHYPKAALRARAQMWIDRLQARPKVVRIQAMKRKWGSCSTRGVVTLAADLGAEPTSVQDVVIVHELLHLKIRNHGRLFKALMSARVPHWRQIHGPSCQVGTEGWSRV